ncbi:MAG: HAD family hydrolase [Clostridia bacterium]|nr:HAD family hydrolase [Clostridia bacterium]
MIQAALFDLDGTLTDTLRDIADAMNRSLSRLGLPAFPIDAYRYLVGDGAKVLARRCAGGHPEMAGELQAIYQADYERHTLVTTRPYDGIPELLTALRERGVRTAVLSNKPDADTRGVVRHFFTGSFDLVRGQLPGVPLKPDPTAALSICEALGLPPERWLYFGDTAVDMTCARNAGMHPVGVTWGFREAEELREAGAESLISRPEEALSLLNP